MREKELRLALVCYGGISLAVYMHGITKEIWRLAKASQLFHSDEGAAGSDDVYVRLLQAISDEGGTRLRVLVDILAGASAGGINAIFLAEAISSGRSLEPLTDLWLEAADVDVLLDQEGSRVSRFAKNAAIPITWLLAMKGGGTVDETVEEAHRDEVRGKLGNFIRARWFAPPFSGPGFTRLLLNAFEAMAAGPAGPPLLPHYQPLDLFVTVTDFHGHPERLRLNSPPEVAEMEHRLTLSFRDRGGAGRTVAEPAELVFAARATASFPGAFPPFTVAELDAALAERGQEWSGREDFLGRALPGHSAIGRAESAVLIDGSVLANAPFRPAIDALQSRPARREVDRRFVYIDPKPGVRSVRLTGGTEAEPPGFFATLLAALSDIPREQPIRDNLEAIEQRSQRIHRLRSIVEAMQPEVDAAVERALGGTFLLGSPTAERLAAWARKGQALAEREAGYAHSAYRHLRLSSMTEEAALAVYRLSGGGKERRDRLRDSFRAALAGPSARLADAIDLGYRTRRLRLLARQLDEFDVPGTDAASEAVHSLIGRYRAPIEVDRSLAPAEFATAEEQPHAALEALRTLLDLEARDRETDAAIVKLLLGLPKAERRSASLAYLGFPFYDIGTLPLLQGEGLDEFNPVKVDRISPGDATAIREGGAEATLKGIQFNSFGAFFSRAYRENDYLWGRLHGADRLIDIAVSALPDGAHMPAGAVTLLKRDAFRTILKEEKPRLTAIGWLFDELEKEIG